MPLYNEQDGIEATIKELDRELSDFGAEISFVVQDDCSTDRSIRILEQISSTLDSALKIETNFTNQRHGPTTVRAYQRAVEINADIVIQLDSDGQFLSSEISAMLQQFISDKSVDLMIGARRNRTDPWYRRVVTTCLRGFILIRFGISSPDPNSPIRFARGEFLRSQVEQLDEDCPIPNIFLTVMYHRAGKVVRYVPTLHQIRRGRSNIGTMWNQQKFKLIVPRSLIVLCISATRRLVFLRTRS